MNIFSILFGLLFFYFLFILFFRLALWLIGFSLKRSIYKGMRNKTKNNHHEFYEKENIIDAEFREIK